MPHDHGHEHHDHVDANRHDAAFAIGVGLNAALVAAQIVFGLLAGSLALIADAGHNPGNVLGLALAWWAATLARAGRRPRGAPTATAAARSSPRSPNAAILLVGVGAIALEAIPPPRSTPGPVAGLTVM